MRQVLVTLKDVPFDNTGNLPKVSRDIIYKDDRSFIEELHVVKEELDVAKAVVNANLYKEVLLVGVCYVLIQALLLWRKQKLWPSFGQG